jgi:glyoxylate reductase
VGEDGPTTKTTRGVLVTRRLPGPAIARIAAVADVTVHEGPGPIPRERLLRDVRGKAGLLPVYTDRVDDELLDAAGDDLAVVANFGVGYDNIDVGACTRRGVLVTNTPDVLTEATADLAWGLLIATARRLGEGERFIRSRLPWVWEPDFMLGADVFGATLGIVGFGRIGRAVARRAAGFGMRVLYHSRRRAREELESSLHAEYRAGLDELLSESDFVSLHVSLSPATRRLLDAERIRRMRSTAILINTSRGAVVDEVALADALREGRIRAAGLDVYEREPEVHPGLLELENVVLVPHLGSATVPTREAMAMLAAENVVAVVEGRPPSTPVNPEVWHGRGATSARRPCAGPGFETSDL